MSLYKITNLTLSQTMNGGFDFQSLTSEDIRKIIIGAIQTTTEWNVTHTIQAISSNKSDPIYNYRSGLFEKLPTTEENKEEKKEIENVMYSFIALQPEGGITINGKNLYKSTDMRVNNFHLLSNQDKVFIFHNVIITNEWPKENCIMAIPNNSNEKIFSYLDNKITVR